MTPLLSLSAYAAKAVLTVLLVALSGAFLVRLKFIKEESLRILSQTVFGMMLPCLLFSKVSKTIDLAALKRYWMLPASCLIFVMTGLALGWAVAKICRVDKGFSRAAMAACSFGNASFIPIPLIAAIVLVFPEFQGRSDAAATGILYISLYLMILSPLLWSVGYLLVFGNDMKSIKVFDVVNPPMIGMLCGIIVGTIPSLKGLFCTSSGILSPLYDASEIVGAAAVPCSLIVLGGRLAYGPVENTLKKRVIVLVGFVKLVLLPLLCVPYLKWMISSGLMPADSLLCLVLMIEAAAPQATNLAIMCSLKGEAQIERNMASLMFWNYLAAIPSLTIFIIVSMSIFK